MTKRSTVLLFRAALLLICYGCAVFADFPYMLYRMPAHGDSLEKLLHNESTTGRFMASVLLLGLPLFASFVISLTLDSRPRTRC